MRRPLSLLALVLFSPFAAAAEPAPLPPPAIEVRVKAIADLTGVIEYAAGVFMQPEAGKQFAGIIKMLGGTEKGLEGIDAANPIGAYVRIAENIADSAIVVMVPVKDEEALIALLKGKLNADPKKDKEGLYTLQLPQLPFGDIHFRFLHGYAYATVRNAKSVDADAVLKPKDFFGAPSKSILSAVVHCDRFPADVKKVMVGQIEMQLAEAAKDAPGSELQKQARKALSEIGVDMVQTILTDAKSLALTFDIDPKTDAISADVKVTAMPKTQLEKNLKSWGDRESMAASVGVAKNPLMSLGLAIKLPSGVRGKLGKIVDVTFDDLLAGAGEDAKPLATKLADAVAPTLKDDDVQLGLLVVKLGREPKIGLRAAVKVTKGTDLEKVLREFAPLLMGGEASVKFDAEKVGDRNLHEGTLTNGDLKKNFGTETVRIITSDDLIALGIEDSAKGLKGYLESKPKALPMLALEIGVAQIGAMTEKNLSAEQYRNVVEKIFGKAGASGADTVKLTVTGGRELDINLQIKGKAVSLLAATDQAKKK